MILNLTPDEIIDITHKVKFKAQVKALRELGIPVKERPDGKPLVARQAYLIAMGVPLESTKQARVEPDLDAIK